MYKILNQSILVNKVESVCKNCVHLGEHNNGKKKCWEEEDADFVEKIGLEYEDTEIPKSCPHKLSHLFHQKKETISFKGKCNYIDDMLIEEMKNTNYGF